MMFEFIQWFKYTNVGAALKNINKTLYLWGFQMTNTIEKIYLKHSRIYWNSKIALVISFYYFD